MGLWKLDHAETSTWYLSFIFHQIWKYHIRNLDVTHHPNFGISIYRQPFRTPNCVSCAYCKERLHVAQRPNIAEQWARDRFMLAIAALRSCWRVSWRRLVYRTPLGKPLMGFWHCDSSACEGGWRCCDVVFAGIGIAAFAHVHGTIHDKYRWNIIWDSCACFCCQSGIHSVNRNIPQCQCAMDKKNTESCQ